MRVFVLVLIVYAACGFAASLVVHLLALAGIQPGGNALFFMLSFGLFPLWLPVTIFMMKLVNLRSALQNFNWRSQFLGGPHWQGIFSGCPAWMKYVMYGLYAYLIANFVYSIIFRIPTVHRSEWGDPPVQVFQFFSSVLMPFYFAGLCVLTTVHRKGVANLVPKCPNGHEIALGDRYCSICGVTIGSQRG